MKTLLFTICALAGASVVAGDESATEGKRPFIGVQLIDIDKKLAKETRCPVRIGATVQAVEDGPAKKVGLKEHDIISRIDGTPMTNAESVADWLNKTEEGKSYALTVYRRSDKTRVWSKLVIHLNVAFINEPPAPVDWRAWEEKQAQLPADQRPFEIKGDRLGMPLDVFKSKHHLARCSDKNPDEDVPALLYKAYYGRPGIVHCAMPSEEATIAGVKADPFICEFVDGKLYRITIFFGHDDYQHVVEALAANTASQLRRGFAPRTTQ